MLYPFMTLNDETEIVHSESMTKDGKEQVKEEVQGFSPEEIQSFQELLETNLNALLLNS